MDKSTKAPAKTYYQVIEFESHELVKVRAMHNFSLEEADQLIDDSKQHSHTAYKLAQAKRHKAESADQCSACKRDVIKALYPILKTI